MSFYYSVALFVLVVTAGFASAHNRDRALSPDAGGAPGVPIQATRFVDEEKEREKKDETIARQQRSDN